MHKNKLRGVNFEREIVNMAKAQGYVADRTWGSHGRSRGFHHEVDVIINGRFYQCKRTKKLAKYVQPSQEVVGQIVREDRGEPYIVMRFQDYLDLIKGR